jgi:predicted nucleic acid-binding protein
MLVIGDSFPIIVLISIGQIGILPKLFGQVVIPPEVTAELLQHNRPRNVRDFTISRPAWLLERAPATIAPILSLHAGELSAISLAQELRADLLLIDEVQGRKVAAELKIPFTGTIGVLELAADQGLLNLKDAFARVKDTDFWISNKLLDERLRVLLAGRRQYRIIPCSSSVQRPAIPIGLQATVVLRARRPGWA